MRRANWIIFTFAVLALAIGPLTKQSERAETLPPIDPSTPALGESAFVPGGVYTTTHTDGIPPGVSTRGSWLQTDVFQGRHETHWFAARPRFVVLVAGYPNLGGNSLTLEARRADGSVQTIRFTENNPREVWQPWLVRVPADVTAVRLIAVDASSDPGGWLAFSQPYIPEPQLGAQLLGILQLIAVTCLALTLLCGPGLLWLQTRARPVSHLALAILPGPLLLVALGLLCWACGGWIAPATLARLGVVALLAWLGWRYHRATSLPPFPRELTAVVGAGALLVGFAVAKATYSGGPAGELFRHTIARTLAVGGHSDARISYQVAQLVGNHFAPFGPEADGYFSPWSFGSRGPLAGLLAAPVMLASGAQTPLNHPDHRWEPFDAQGYATYRVTLIVLASLSAWAVFGLLAAVASPRWGFVGALILQLAPFFVHELYFTWPKLMSAALVLGAFFLTHRRQPFAAGLVLGTGYLFHPLAVLSAPFLALWALAQPQPTLWRRLLPPTLLALGTLTLVVPWQIVGRWHPGEGATAQAIFLHYFRMADNAAATWTTWWQTRWDNFAYTFIPGYLFTADPTHESLNSYYGPSDRWVRASFIYWNTLPFALGLPGFLLVAAAIASACRRAPGIAFTTFVGPALLLIAYWGAAKTGLMRHCGHALFLCAIALAAWSLAQTTASWRRAALRAFFHPTTFAWRAFEIALVAFGTTFLNQPPRLDTPFGWSDLFTLVLAAACLIAAVVLLARTARRLAIDEPHTSPALASATA